MKSYDELLQETFLTERQNQRSVFASIIQAPNLPPVFFTPTLMKRLDYTIPNVVAFHVTEKSAVVDLVALEGRKNAQLSVFLSNNKKSEFRDMVGGGIETSGGVLAELKGDINAYFSFDAFTYLSKGGRRLVHIGDRDFERALKHAYPNVKNEVEATSKDLRLRLQKLRGDLMRKHLFPSTWENLSNSGHDWIKAQGIKTKSDFIDFVEGLDDEFRQYKEISLVPNPQMQLSTIKKELDSGDMISAHRGSDTDIIRNNMGLYPLFKIYADPRAIQKFVQSYMDGVEKIMKENPSYRILFNVPYTGYSGYDEAVMSNFTIQKIHRPFMDEPENQKEREDAMASMGLQPNNSIPVEFWHNNLDALYNRVQEAGSNFAELYTKKIQALNK